MTNGVWLVKGVQAAGKSTVADLMARQFERGVHVRGGQFYRWAVRGWVQLGDERAAEARRLLDLRYRLAALAADEYCQAASAQWCRTTSSVLTLSPEDLDGFLDETPR